MRAVNATGFAILGAGLIAIAYGLARYAYGLFVPSIRSELGLSADAVGVVGSMAFISFCLASVVAPLIVDRLGARYSAVLSGLFALAGLTLISQAGDAITLGAGVFACGICTGLMMPALSSGVQTNIRPDLRGRVNAVMNAGTSAGLILCVPAVLLLSGAWRMAYGSFAVLAALGIVAALLLLPSASKVGGGKAKPAPLPLDTQRWLTVGRLTVFCFAMGVAGSAYWIFAPDLVVEIGGLSERLTGMLWLVVGIAGLAGAWASDLGDRLGAPATQAIALVALGAATALVAAAPGDVWMALVSAAVFGWAFMTLTGLYLVTGIRLLRERPSMGPVVPFLAITVGQAVGSPLVGWAIGNAGYVEAFLMFATLAVLIAAFSFLFPRPASDAADEGGEGAAESRMAAAPATSKRAMQDGQSETESI
ncbi:major facilitator superfamily MFS_1 [Halorhodospira halophila SL1]|uniref:Major facilitator superfamily MFS_1 n=2 Tax=Halorhodospira halophila TaxID=1053 RepID=A1WU25_HALHL|nr:major facilitator superfamily MFS_1 [Halorhodospira halophila SL1]MBK1729620.1 MFS transporter [Halorhodospira halophila]